MNAVKDCFRATCSSKDKDAACCRRIVCSTAHIGLSVSNPHFYYRTKAVMIVEGVEFLSSSQSYLRLVFPV